MAFAFVLSQTLRARITEEAARVLAQHGRLAPVNIAQCVRLCRDRSYGAGRDRNQRQKSRAEIATV